MTPERYRQVGELYHAALEVEPEKRASFLDEACSGDVELRNEVESLIASHEEAADFIASPALAVAAELLAQTDADELIGKTIARYRILSLIGAGGMGRVYLAEDTNLGRRVALKFLPEYFTNDKNQVQRFRQEARAASALNHPNILTVYEVGQVGGTEFIATEYVEGETLRSRLKTVSFTPREALTVAIQIADALIAAHEAGIVHRDIKPENVMLRRDGYIKVLDFGLAKLTENVDGTSPTNAASTALPIKTNPGVVMGTAEYMSPEQTRGLSVDARTDIWSLGVIIYEMIANRRPFEAATHGDVIVSVLERDPTPLQQNAPAATEELAMIVTRALAKKVDERYQTVRALSADLRAMRRRIEVEADIELDAASGSINSADRNISAQIVASSATAAAVTDPSAARTTSSVEYLVSEIKKHHRAIALLSVFLILLLASGAYGIFRLFYRSTIPAKPLTERDTIVVGDFVNSTGDPVFDDTLKQGLSVQLAQSPFLALVPARKVAETLKMMGRGDDRLTIDLAREVCLRTSSKAVITGTIASVGSAYVIGLNAMDCETGATLAELQERASNKDTVFTALDAAAVTMRTKLGESLNTVQKYSTPLREATTSSLEALKTYSVAMRTESTNGASASLPFLLRTVELDPSFAEAYASLSSIYGELNQPERAEQYARRAFELSKNASEVERFAIETNYYELATREPEKAAQTCELWRESYPRDARPVRDLAYMHASLGKHEEALTVAIDAMKLGPHTIGYYVILGHEYANVNQLNQSRAVYDDSAQRKLEDEILTLARYQLAFVMDDQAQMDAISGAAVGNAGTESLLLAAQSDTDAWHGRFTSARDLLRRAVDSALQHDAKETAAIYEAEAALREVEVGNILEARQHVNSAIKLAPNRDVRYLGAIALARGGYTAAAEKLSTELEKKSPLDTLVQRYWLPSIRAAVALNRNKPDKAIDLLNQTRPIELSMDYLTTVNVCLCPAYLRAQAYLMLHDGARAAAEFEKFIDYRGLVGNFPWGALARLGLARAHSIEGDRIKARHEYEDFFNLWKGGDPDIPLLRQAKSEYSKLG